MTENPNMVAQKGCLPSMTVQSLAALLYVIQEPSSFVFKFGHWFLIICLDGPGSIALRVLLAKKEEIKDKMVPYENCILNCCPFGYNLITGYI